MARTGSWIDLLDPTPDEIRANLPEGAPRTDVELLAGQPGRAPRPTLRGAGDHVVGAFLNAVAVPEEDLVYYQEVGVVVTRETIVTVRRTPTGHRPFDTARLRYAAERGALPGMIAYHLVDEVAESFLHLLDAMDEEIEELEERIDDWPVQRTHRRLRALRHDLLHVRRVLTPTRDAVRGVADGRVDVEGRPLFTREVFPRDVELRFAAAQDKLLRAGEALELARDLLGAVRDYHQAQIANSQNDVVRRLTAVAALLLFPTFVVGVYGQNFERMPELGWRLGYAFSWAVIVVVTIGQLVFFRRRGWL